jgi:hypothetical protein
MITVHILSLAAGVLSALPLLVASNEPGGLLLLLLAPLPLFGVGLAHGAMASVVAGGTVLVIAAVAAGLLAAGGALAFMVGPSVLLVRQALLNRVPAGAPAGDGGAPDLEWYPPGLLVGWLPLIGMAWLALYLAFMLGEPDGMEALVRRNLEEALGLWLTQVDPAQIAGFAERMAGYVLGIGIVGWLLVLAINGALAQGALAGFGRNLRPSPDPVDMDLPRWIAPALALALAGAFLLSGDLGFAAKNLVAVLLLPFFFAGLAVVHAFARRSKAGRPLLVLFYALLVLFNGLAAFVVLLGLFDQWANIRRRLTAAAPGQEEE